MCVCVCAFHPDLPVVDDSSLSVSAQGLIHLLGHFEPFSEQHDGRHQRTLLARLTSVRYVGGNGGGGGVGGRNDDDNNDIAIIRRVALNLANRNRTLERDVQISATEAWTAKEQAKSLCNEMESTHKSLLQLSQDATSTERQRVKELQTYLQTSQTEIRKLEESITHLTQQKSSMIPANEHVQLRSSYEEVCRRKNELESEVSNLQRTLQTTKESSQLQYQLGLESFETRLNTSSQRQKELLEENGQLQTYLKRKTSELSQMERTLIEMKDFEKDLHKNLETCMSKNQTLIERIRLIEKEVGEHRQFSHQLKTSTLQFESSKQHWELTLASLQSELREKERELSQTQELVRTLTAATRAATNELDAQLHINATRTTTTTMTNLRRPSPTTTTTTHSHQPAPTTTTPIYLTSPYGTTLATPNTIQQHPHPQAATISQTTTSLPTTASTIHLRHHPGGRLSMDVTGGGGIIPTGDNWNPTVSHQPPQSHDPPLRFDDLPPESASAPPSAYRTRAQTDA